MRKQSDPISYLVKDPSLGGNIRNIIENKLLDSDIRDFHICVDETYPSSEEIVIYIDQCSEDIAIQIRSILNGTFEILDDDFDAHYCFMPKGYGNIVKV